MSQKAPFGGNSRAIGDNGNALDRPGMGIKVPQDFAEGPEGAGVSLACPCARGIPARAYALA